MNSNNLLTTVFKNFQWALKNRGYCPTTYLPTKPTITKLKIRNFIYQESPPVADAQ
jgi:hypothetical protein